MTVNESQLFAPDDLLSCTAWRPDRLAQILFRCSRWAALPLEEEFSPHATTTFAANNWWLPALAVAAYIVLVSIGPRIMEMRKDPFDLRWQLAAWNAFMCAFSLIGTLRTVRRHLTALLIYAAHNEISLLH